MERIKIDGAITQVKVTTKSGRELTYELVETHKGRGYDKFWIDGDDRWNLGLNDVINGEKWFTIYNKDLIKKYNFDDGRVCVPFFDFDNIIESRLQEIKNFKKALVDNNEIIKVRAVRESWYVDGEKFYKDKFGVKEVEYDLECKMWERHLNQYKFDAIDEYERIYYIPAQELLNEEVVERNKKMWESMDKTVTCPACEHEYNFADSVIAGKNGNCPKCRM